jgi:phosphopantetheinyl transferase
MSIILKKQISQNLSVAVWQITETEEFFYNFLRLSAEDEAKIKSIKLQKVRLQKLACRAALADLFGKNEVSITYSENGQPQLKNHYISFSHTEKTVAVALATTPVGIDIEEITPRILPLYPRFMSPKEMETCDVENMNDLYYFWCAKEAMYKWHALKNLDFIEDLFVDKNERKGLICKKYPVQLSDFYFDNLLVVVCNSSQKNISLPLILTKLLTSKLIHYEKN